MTLEKSHCTFDGKAMKKWDEKYASLLGTKPDADLARDLDLPRHVVKYQRDKRGINPPSVEIKLWTGEEIALLGTDTDAEIGRVLRRSASSVLQARLNRGIPAYRVAIGSPERRERAGLIRINDSTRDLISELEPLLLLRYQAAGLPIDRLDPWQIVEIALRELQSSMKNGASQ